MLFKMEESVRTAQLAASFAWAVTVLPAGSVVQPLETIDAALGRRVSSPCKGKTWGLHFYLTQSNKSAPT